MLEIGCHCVAWAGQEFVFLLPQPLKRYGNTVYTHGNTALPRQSYSAVTGYGSEEARSDGEC